MFRLSSIRMLSGSFAILLCIEYSMRYLWNHIQYVIDNYKGEVPLTHFLKAYCRKHPVLGSRDRRMLSEMAYCWYRCSKGIASGDGDQLSFQQQLRQCLVLCGAFGPVFDRMFADIDSLAAPASFIPEALFSYEIAMSGSIEREAWLRSMLVQPGLFIRVRKNREQICAILDKNGIPWSFTNEQCMSLPNGAAIDTLLPADSYVIQDASSQHTGSSFAPQKGQSWYDCCSGAGGKSLLLMDAGVDIRLTVSDKRRSILANLEERFRRYGHKKPQILVADASAGKELAALLGGKQFDNILADVPCSGSGTWARTPEQLYFFTQEQVAAFAALQTAIVLNVSKQLKPGGRLIYITCSVFRQENEDVVRAVCAATGLRVMEMQLINGIEMKADSMFVSVMQ